MYAFQQDENIPEVTAQNSVQRQILTSANPPTHDDAAFMKTKRNANEQGVVVHTISDKIPSVPMPSCEYNMSDSHPTPDRKILRIPVPKQNSSATHEKNIHGVPILTHKLPARPVIVSTSLDFPAFPVTPTGVSVIPTASSAEYATLAQATSTSAREMYIDACFVAPEILSTICKVSTPT